MQRKPRTVHTEETLDDIGHRLEHCPSESLRRLSQQVGISYRSLQKNVGTTKVDICSTSVNKVSKYDNL